MNMKQRYEVIKVFFSNLYSKEESENLFKASSQIVINEVYEMKSQWLKALDILVKIDE